MPLTIQLFQHLLAVAAVTEGGVIAHLTGLDIQHLQNLADHNGQVHSGRSLAALNDLCHILLILLRLMFLIFFAELTGVGAFVANASLVGLLVHRGLLSG